MKCLLSEGLPEKGTGEETVQNVKELRISFTSFSVNLIKLWPERKRDL